MSSSPGPRECNGSGRKVRRVKGYFYFVLQTN